MLFTIGMATRDRLVHRVEKAEDRVVSAIMADAIKYDKALAKAARKSERRQERIERYESYAEASRKALTQYDQLATQYASKHHPKVARTSKPRAATA